MKVLVTGAGGFVGRHIARELVSAGMEVVLTSDKAGCIQLPGGTSLPILSCNIADRQSLGTIFGHAKPDAVVHLAAISHVQNAQNSREILSEINSVGTHNVCAAAAAIDKEIKFLFVSTSLVYGQNSFRASQNNETLLLNEASFPYPESAYGASKLAGEFIARSFASDRFKTYIVRPFNHIGPGQHESFVCPSLALKIASIENGGTIKVGNLKTFRDFTDVRDIVCAYRLILELCPEEDLFVLGSESVIQIEEILKMFIELSGKEIFTEVDRNLLRGIDPPRLCSDPARARKSLGWSPRFSIESTLKEIYQETSDRWAGKSPSHLN